MVEKRKRRGKRKREVWLSEDHTPAAASSSTSGEDGADADGSAAGEGVEGRYRFGEEVDSDTREYFARVEKLLQEGDFEEEEDREALVSNMFTEIADREVLLCVDRQCSRVMQSLIPVFDKAQLRKFVCAVLKSGDFCWLARSCFGAHVVQVLLSRLSSKIIEDYASGGFRDEDDDDEDDDDEEEEEEEKGEGDAEKNEDNIVVDKAQLRRERAITKLSEKDVKTVHDLVVAMWKELSTSVESEGEENPDEPPKKRRVKDGRTELAFHQYGTFVYRSFVQTMGGYVPTVTRSTATSVDDDVGAEDGFAAHNTKRRRERENQFNVPPKAVPVVMTTHLCRYVDDVLLPQSGSNISGFWYHRCGNPAGQSLMRGLSLSPRCDATRFNLLNRLLSIDEISVEAEQAKKLLKGNSDKFNTDAHLRQYCTRMSSHPLASHMLQVVIESSPIAHPSLYMTLYQAFRGSLATLSQHALGNYVVQSLVRSAVDEPQLRMMMQELVGRNGSGIKSLIDTKRSGVVLKLVQASTQFLEVQSEVCECVCKAVDLQTKTGNNVIRNLLALDQRQVFGDSGGPKFSVIGSLIIQAFLKFDVENTQRIYKGLTSLDSLTLLNMCTDPSASWVVTSVFGTKDVRSAVSSSVKHTVIETLKGNLAKISMTSQGSRIVDGAYANVDMSHKIAMAGELSKSLEKLRGSTYGRFVIKNCKLERYAQKKDAWASGEEGAQKKREMFSDILDDSGEAGGGGKKKKKKEISKRDRRKREEEDSLTKMKKDEIDDMWSGGGGGGGGGGDGGAANGDNNDDGDGDDDDEEDEGERVAGSGGNNMDFMFDAIVKTKKKKKKGRDVVVKTTADEVKLMAKSRKQLKDERRKRKRDGAPASTDTGSTDDAKARVGVADGEKKKKRRKKEKDGGGKKRRSKVSE
eukprot:TRINITY_DN540_c0_g1_i1.p1 TRINITY_DN540_c0_g1~~TRINITY_DN540_c0_g1_i1.p1  ORF type:complete len:916 (+),score=325.10 TRINITY_DN540_c0_g1_i1:85-2832(+)